MCTIKLVEFPGFQNTFWIQNPLRFGDFQPQSREASVSRQENNAASVFWPASNHSKDDNDVAENTKVPRPMSNVYLSITLTSEDAEVIKARSKTRVFEAAERAR